MCKDCMYKQRRRVADAKPKRIAKRTVSKETIEYEKQKNKEHREFIAVEKKRKFKQIGSTQEECDNMVAKFLKHNEPSVKIVHNQPFKHVTRTMYIKGTQI